MPSVVYILTNPAMPGLVKIGRTDGVAVETRLRQLDTTCLPLPFECFYAVEVQDAHKVERALHDAFDDHRIRSNREFFRLSPDRPKAVLKLLELRDVTPKSDIVETDEDQRALNRERDRRASFRFSMVGIQPGAQLHSVFDDDLTCTVVDDRQVNFRGKDQSLTAAALEVAREQGYKWQTIAGPQYWKFDGRTLSELREQSEDETTIKAI
jgi:T5orf172 domain